MRESTTRAACPLFELSSPRHRLAQFSRKPSPPTTIDPKHTELRTELLAIHPHRPFSKRRTMAGGKGTGFAHLAIRRVLIVCRQNRRQDWWQGRWRYRWQVSKVTLREGRSPSTFSFLGDLRQQTWPRLLRVAYHIPRPGASTRNRTPHYATSTILSARVVQSPLILQPPGQLTNM